MSSKVQQSVCSDCVTYEKSRIDFNNFNTFNNVLKELCGFSDKFGGEVSLTCDTDDGYRVKISARKLTEEEIEKLKSENEEEEEYDE